MMNEEDKEAIEWAKEVIEGHRRGNGEVGYIKQLLNIIERLEEEKDILLNSEKW